LESWFESWIGCSSNIGFEWKFKEGDCHQHVAGNLQAPTADASQDIIMKNGGLKGSSYELHLKWTRLVQLTVNTK